MQFSWNVLTDDQILGQQENLQPGIYPFEVQMAEYKRSKSSGNPMVELKLKIWGNDGREYMAFDYLIAKDSMIYKTKNFWNSVGNPEIYEQGNCEEGDFYRKTGKCKTKLEKSVDGTRMNIRVVDYVITQKTKETVVPETKLSSLIDEPELHDDIPF